MLNFKKIIKLIVDILTYLLIVVVALYLVFAIYNKFITKDKMLLAGKYYIFQIATGSMEHELVAGDFIVVEKCDDYKVGDIITYVEDNYYITHRINKISEDKIITKGDANSSSDSPISKDKIVGKFLFKEKILTFLTKYKIMVIAILIALIILESAFSKDNEKKEDTVKNDLEKQKIALDNCNKDDNVFDNTEKCLNSDELNIQTDKDIEQNFIIHEEKMLDDIEVL